MNQDQSSFGDVAKIPYNLCKGSNPSGIPKVNFIDDVNAFLEQDGATVDSVLRVQQELLSKFKYYESHIIRNKSSLKTKVPEIKESLTTIKFLIKKKEASEPVDVDFTLCDNVYTAAEVDKENDKVGLWLGANVMLEYTYQDALDLLQKNLTQAETKITSLNRDLDFLKDQITTLEVSIARVYNHDVKTRREVAARA